MPANMHSAMPLLTAGAAPEHASATVVMLHGRGASAESMLEFFEEFGVPGVAAVAPQAANHTWYSHSFLAPLEANQPWVGWALERVEEVVAGVLKRGQAAEKIVVLGFSQGACLACESVARYPRRYGALIALTGGLIGPSGTARNYAGSLAGVPVLLTAGDPDPHVPFSRVIETRDALERMGAAVDMRRYPGRPHTISAEEFAVARELIQRVAGLREG